MAESAPSSALARLLEQEQRLEAMLAGVVDRDPPGWFGRTLSEAFNDRPWLDEVDQEGRPAS